MASPSPSGKATGTAWRTSSKTPIPGPQKIRFRNNPEWSHIPIIIQSFAGPTKDIEAAYYGGADLFILKSDFSKDFQQILKTIFQRDWTTRTRPRKSNFFLSAGE
jgi:hypothetical protein